MSKDMEKARQLLAGEVTCAVCRDEQHYTTTRRGVKPLAGWLEQGLDLRGFSAADRVVGRATAFLYILLGVRAVWARVMSAPAAEVLRSAGIEVSCEQEVSGIINRRGDGPCPFEAAVLHITDPAEALAAIRRKMEEMGI